MNGWYVSNVTVTLNATDDMSGVNVTYYSVGAGDLIVYTEPFTLSDDGIDILIVYYSVDYAGNLENLNLFMVDIDRTKPEIYLTCEYWGNNCFEFHAFVDEYGSFIERVEFYINNELQNVTYGGTYHYTWDVTLDIDYFLRGFILRRKITEEKIRFYAILVKVDNNFWPRYSEFSAYAYDNAGNSDYDWIDILPEQPEYKTCEWFVLENDYKGYVGRFFIFATFKKYNGS